LLEASEFARLSVPLARHHRETERRRHGTPSAFSPIGGFLLADRVKLDPERSRVSIVIDNKEIHGLADGVTTNAVIAKLRRELRITGDEGLANALAKARFNWMWLSGLRITIVSACFCAGIGPGSHQIRLNNTC
jgi:hypothetical protein